MNYLLDTCVLSELVKRKPDTQVLNWIAARQADELYICAMTWGELQRGVAKLPESRRHSELTQWLQELESGFAGRILVFNQHVAQIWARMVVQAEARGKSIAAFDSIIAATAQAYTCQLVTRNVRDFAHTGVDVFDPWQAR